MKILFDHQIFCWQRFGGVSKYFCEMISELPSHSWELSLLCSNNEYIDSTGIVNQWHFFPHQKFRGQERILLEINKLYSIYKLRKGDYDVFHQTHFLTYCLPHIGKKAMVTTFHDINLSTHNKNEELVKLQLQSMQRADKIIAISHNTKKDMEEVLNIPTEKIVVIHHGISRPYADNVLGKPIIDGEYILYVGRREEYKNFGRLAQAFAALTREASYRHLKLVCTGQGFEPHEKQLLNDLKIANKVVVKACNEVEMANLYRYAQLFVFPSIYEGFGMPILEAMSYQCPTVIANASCFPEIAGDASLYFDPYSVESIVFSMKQGMENVSLRNDLIQRGKEKCNTFTWKRCAEQHFSVYTSLA